MMGSRKYEKQFGLQKYKNVLCGYLGFFSKYILTLLDIIPKK